MMRNHMIIDTKTGDKAVVAFTREEEVEADLREMAIATATRIEIDPVERLRAFLKANPDVLRALNG